MTTYAPLVPCPVSCPEGLVNVELEPCSPEYCTCTNGIGYLVVRQHNAQYLAFSTTEFPIPSFMEIFRISFREFP